MNYFVSKAIFGIFFLVFYCYQQSYSYSADRIWFEFRKKTYRVHILYTIPELRQFRHIYVDFYRKKKAEKFFSEAVQGIDYYLQNSRLKRFLNQSNIPQPW